MVLIVLCAKKRNGKDTFADHLVNNHKFHRLSFAGPLKSASRELFGFTDRDLEEDKEKIHPFWKKTPRQILQFLGTEMFRDKFSECIPWVTDTFWIQKMKLSYEQLQKEYGKNVNVVITDCRFFNEASAVREMSGVIIGIKRVGYGEGDTHSSEKEIDEIKKDMEILNDSTVEALHEKAELIYSKLNK